MVGRELRKLGADLLERQPDALGEDDEGDTAEDWRADSADGPEPARSEVIRPRCS